MQPGGRVLLTGASGYIGGRLLRRLESDGRRVVCLTRRPDVLTGRTGSGGTTVAAADLLDAGSLAGVFEGVDVAYYLVHSIGGKRDFEDLDRRAAANFARAAKSAGVRQIIYLGGLGHERDLSAHLASRHEVGALLRRSGIPLIELRASIVIGSGSASFETVRALVEQLPVIIAPRWIRTLAQPIAIEDVIDYLAAAIELGPRDATYEIGGSDRVTYADVMSAYARRRRLHRRVVPTRLVTPAASRVALGLLTPVYGPVAAAMVDSLRNETTADTRDARDAFAIEPRGVDAAIERALANEDEDFAQTRWSDALPAQPPRRWGGVGIGRRLVTTRSLRTPCEASEAFAPIQRIGGRCGWYAADWFWRARGLLDTLRGGVGLRRGRRDPYDLRVGDTVDFWRVERFESDATLSLAAEMKIPGRLWLQFEVTPNGSGSLIRQTTIFDPAGYVGLAYWYLLYPVHHRVFGSMLRAIGSRLSDQTASPRAL